MTPKRRILFGGNFVAKLIAAFKIRVFGDSGTFEAESCLNTTIQDLVNKGLYDSASLIVTPNAVKSGKIFSLKGTDLTFTRASVANRTNSVGLIESMATGVPRIEYPVGGGCPSILLEPQRTNLITKSCQFTNAAWITNASGVTLDNQVLAPNNTLTAGTFESTGSNALLQNANATVTVATVYSNSIWVKLISGSSVVKLRDVSGNETAIVPTGTWQKFSTVLAATSTTGRVAIVIVTAGTKIAVWNGQLEVGAFSTSDIITDASTVTRIADVYTQTFAAIPTGTLFIHLVNNIPLAGPGTHLYGPFNLDVGGAGLGIASGRINGGRIRLWTTNTVSTIYQTTADVCKLAITFDGTYINVWQNGVKVVTNYAYAMTNVTKLYSYSTLETPQYIKGINLYSLILSDSQLSLLTT